MMLGEAAGQVGTRVGDLVDLFLAQPVGYARPIIQCLWWPSRIAWYRIEFRDADYQPLLRGESAANDFFERPTVRLVESGHIDLKVGFHG